MGVGVLIMTVAVIAILAGRVETGFMVRECIEGTGVTAETKWSKTDLPIPVWLAVEDSSLGSDVEKAVEYWAPYLKWGNLYQPLDRPFGPIVIIESMPLQMERPHGVTVLKWVGQCQIRMAEIKIPMPLQAGRVRECVVRHELGHALGLDHDDDEDSVMHPERGWRFKCDITKYDQALLQTAYGERI